MQDLARSVQEFLLGLDSSIEEVPKKYYVAYKISQNIACMEIQKQRVLLYVKLDPKKIEMPKKIARDVTNIGHYGTGALELSVRAPQDIWVVKPLLEQAYQKIGGSLTPARGTPNPYNHLRLSVSDLIQATDRRESPDLSGGSVPSSD